jgi:FKBP-type peptidyl-prolyl cis-trans isomerase
MPSAATFRTCLVRLAALAVVSISIAACAGGGTGSSAPADVAAPPADSVKTPSGLSTRVLEKGSGTRHPRLTDRVSVHYSGWTTDGKPFDSSGAQPATFAVNGVIDGWTEALQMMVEGEKRRLWIPESLAYRGQPGAPAGMLVFDVQLVKIE